jgi:hypothetical protein
MKHSPLFFLFLIASIGCGHKAALVTKEAPKAAPVVKPLPRAVHDACIDVWAVRVRDAGDAGWGDFHSDEYWGKYYVSDAERRNYNYPANGDSVDYAAIGNEFQFKDSVTAMRIYHDFVYRRDRPQQIADSIFKCKHSYN